MAGVKQNRYKTNNGCIKHLPQTGTYKYILIRKAIYSSKVERGLAGGGNLLEITMSLNFAGL